MLTVKTLKPYYIKSDPDYVRLILGYQYFTVFINEEEYQFIPVEAKEIKIDRRTRKIVNTEDKFAFQKEKDIMHITMNELIHLPDFMVHLYDIAKPYYIEDPEGSEQDSSTDMIVQELERLNVKRLIDKALDERDETAFSELVNML